MIKALFTSDLHGSIAKYEFLLEKIRIEQPEVVFIGGDLLGLAAYGRDAGERNFFLDYLAVELQKLKNSLKSKYPGIFVIMGNDDPKSQEDFLRQLEHRDLLFYVNEKKVPFKSFTIAGYSYVPPTPFMNKDWEKYDVSRYVDAGCISPEEGFRSVPVEPNDLRFFTIKRDLEKLFGGIDLSKTVCLFHSPPYQTKLDRAALDGRYIDHVPLDVHVGSIAIKEFIVSESPYLTLHGHIHESSRLTGSWLEKIGRTICLQGALEYQQKGIISFDLEKPEAAEMLTQ